ncbi:hypothetical protein BsWGS_28535 [Bradybaena similaris]
MASVLVLVISVIISVFLAPVISQMDIVNMKTVEDGTPFKITCNAQRVIATQGNVSTISVLQIFISSNAAHVVSNGAQDYKMVAQYITLPLDGDNEMLQDPPAGRKWQFSFNGSNSENRGANNKATMKIEILVSDTTCADAGLYKCVMSYSSNKKVFPDSNVQNVTSTAKTTEPLIVLDPIYDAPTGVTNTSAYDLGANITVSCSFLGPEELGMKWKREVRPAMGVDIRYEDYPIMNDITTEVATRQPGTSTACPEYAHKSVLKLTISDDDNERRYLCVVMSDNEETTSSSAAYITVGGSGPSTPSSGNVADASSKPDNIGLIIGLAVGIPLAIIIVVVIIVVVCRRRSKGSDKSKHEADRPDGGHEQYVPPPVLYSRPNKGVNNNNNNRDSKVPPGKVNEGLDNSFDSKDSAYKGPPVYTITNQRPQSQGRQNPAFDSELKSAVRQQPQESDPRYYNYEPRPPGRRYSTDDNTDAHRDYYEDENFGTGV